MIEQTKVLDVDAVLEASAALLNSLGCRGQAIDTDEARAAVAELRITAAALLAAASASAARREPLNADAPAITNLRAALARIGGAP